MNRAMNTQAFLDRCRDIVLNSAAMIESRRNMDSAVTSMNQVLTSLTHLQSNSPQLETSFSHLLLALSIGGSRPGQTWAEPGLKSLPTCTRVKACT